MHLDRAPDLRLSTPPGRPPPAQASTVAAGPLVPLHACAGEPAARAGRKAAVLGWAQANGLATPGGLVVPAERFRAALETCRALERTRYLEQAALRLEPRHALGIAASVAHSLRSPEVEALARADAEEAFARVGAPLVVCRSSSAMEDGRRAAFPGVFLSVLGIETADGLASAIAACWRSVFSADAMRYLLRVRVEPVDFSLAVLVQRQVEAAWFGVYVGVDPLTGSGEPRADLSDAGPDALVDGARATVRAHRRDGRWSGLGSSPSLATPLEKVHEAAGRLARHLHADVDVEFAVPPRGGPVILQCRPVTGAAQAPGASDAVGDGVRLSGRACAAGSAVGTATDPRGARAGEDDGPPRIAVVEQVTTADYDVVFHHAGVVAEHDASSLSHVAILCRELGVPFVCGVDDARARLVGRRVAVDGTSGGVRVLGDGDDAPRATGRGAEPDEPGAEPAVGAVELLLRVLAEGRPGHPPAAEAGRVARRCARALGADAVRVVGHPVAARDLERLERLGAGLFGPGFSAAAFLAEVAGKRLPT